MDQTNQFTPINNSMPTNIPPSAQIPNSFPTTEKSKKVGPIIAVLVVILVIVIVALYLLASRVSVNSPVIDNLQANSTEQTPVAEIIPQDIAPITNTDDDINSLQADLDASIKGIDTQGI